MKKVRISKQNKTILVLAALNVVTMGQVVSQASSPYTWTGAGADTNWSTSGNWDSTPPTGGPGTGDTAILGDTAANRTVNYNSTNAALATLTLQQTNAFVNTLDINKNLAITNAVTLGAAIGGTSRLYVDPLATNNTTKLTDTAGFTINSGGVIELSTYSYTSGGSTILSTAGLTGPVTINSGGSLISDRNRTVLVADSLTTAITGNLSMSADGTLSWGSVAASGNGAASTVLAGINTTASLDRLSVTGNLSITGGSVIVGTPANADTSGNEMLLGGATNSITGLSTTFTPFVVLISTNPTTTFLSDSTVAGGLSMRSNVAATTTQNQTYLIGATAPTGLLKLNSALRFQAKALSSTMTLQLASDIDSGSVINVFNGGATTDTFGIELNGHTLDVSRANAVEQLPKANVTTAWSITNSGGGTGAAGTFKATAFDLSVPTGGVTVGPNVTLQAVGAGGTTNTLSNTIETFDPTSTFAYAGTGTTASFAKLISTHPIGNLAVNSGALQLSGPISTGTGSVTTVADNGILDLGTKTLTTTSVSSTGLLGGSGTFATTAGVTSSGSFSPGESGTIGALNLTGSGLILTSTDDADFDIASASSFDTVELNGLPVSYGGTLTLDFTTAPADGATFALFDDGVGSADFLSIVTNLPQSQSASFDPGSGVLSIASAVPEPTSIALLGVAGFGLLSRRRRGQSL